MSNMDMYEIKYFLKSLGYTAEFLKQLKFYEKEFLIERAKELHIKGMQEFLETGNFNLGRRKRIA